LELSGSPTIILGLPAGKEVDEAAAGIAMSEGMDEGLLGTIWRGANVALLQSSADRGARKLT